MAAHQSRLCQIINGDDLDDVRVSQRVIVGTATDMPMEANFFPGILEGLLGSLSINALGGKNPLRSAKEDIPDYGLQRW